MNNYYEITTTVSGTKGNGKFENTFGAELSLDEFGSFADIVKFADSAKTAWKKARSGIKAGYHVHMEVIAATYEGKGAALHTVSFDRWETHSEDLSSDDDGIYLRADARYTDPVRDMYLTKDVLHDLGATLS